MKPKAASRDPKELKFEEALQRLEEIVQEMESGDLPLEDILKKYEEGNKLAQACAARLNEAEKRIEILMKEKNGSLGLKPFDTAEDEPPEKTAAGKTREEDEESEDADQELF